MSEVARKHDEYMREALVLAASAAEAGDVPVGCVVVRGNEVVGRGANEIQRSGDPTRHAEMVAIEEAVRTIGEKFLEECTLYVTLEPCAMCAGAIVLARIPTVVYGAADEKTGACRSVFEILDNPQLNHRATVRTGILEQECSAILSDFFTVQRKRETTDNVVKTQAEYGTSSVKPGGVLWLVPTPIGNLDDMTLRAVKTLREADVIVCEDTRHSSPMLKRYDVPKKPLLSYHEHNERDRAREIVERVASGQRVALISDAGMPGISDPGYRAVRACIEAGLTVTALPGASAMITAAAASGLPTDILTFVGFPPQKKGRTAFLERVLRQPGTIIMYESPYRIVDLMRDIEQITGPDRQAVVARELSKLHEEYVRGTVHYVIDVLASRASVKGECVVLIGGEIEVGES
ncbi:MAG: 16S rRNA (cytidine(1402)-2'-O)-methyltransferase [Candidatus Kapabacteria bacterium]|nr:16S rRNA (cytidine(1402)-2'-O)-methyltransferase [Candidatus Kapabacteria bacterium]